MIAVSMAAPAQARRARAQAGETSSWSQEQGSRRYRPASEARNFWDEPSDPAPRRAREARVSRSVAEEPGSGAEGGHHAGPRPGKWCGWYMRTQRGGGPELNIAANWARYGSASGPQVGAVVVWPHHVGEIVGQAANGQWIVRSGNDSGRVRERARSVSGARFRVG